MVDAFTRLGQFLFSPIGIFLMVIIVIIIIVYIFVFRRPGFIFKGKDMKELNRDDNRGKFKLFRVKTSGKIYHGLNLIGKYNSFIHEKYIEPQMKWSNKKGQLVTEDNAKNVDYDHFTFRICKIPFVWIFGIGVHYLRVDKDTFTFQPTKKNINIFINENIHPSEYGGVWISNTKHIDTVHDACYKYVAESTMTQIANYPNRMVFYETAHAKAINKIKTKEEIKSKSFKEYKKAEAEDDEAETGS